MLKSKKSKPSIKPSQEPVGIMEPKSAAGAAVELIRVAR